jgi:hypothetical protein
MTSPDQQQRWAAEREARRLTRNDESFAHAGLMTMLDDPGLLVAVHPADPWSTAVDFGDDLLHVLPERFTGRTANGVELMGSTIVTDSALGRFAQGEKGWRAYVAIQRHGGVEVGIGASLRYQRQRDDYDGRQIYRLHYIVHAIRVAVESQGRALALTLPIEGPFELVVAVPGTGGSLLGGLADGWEDPVSWLDGNTCVTSEVLVRAQVNEWPTDDDGQSQLIVSMAHRVCNGWGTTERLFAPPNRTPNAGRLLKTYA